MARPRRRRLEPWRETSLQTRITSLTIGLISGGLLLSGLGTHVMLSNYLFSQVDQQLTSTAATLADANISELSTIAKTLPTSYYPVYFADTGAVLRITPQGVDNDDLPQLATLRKALSANDYDTPYTIVAQGETWRFVNVSVSSGIGLVVGIPIVSVTQTLLQYTNIFVSFGILVLLAAGIAAWFMSGSLFAPLKRAEDAAAAIAAGDYTKRLPFATTNTEVGRLNHSLNVMTDRIEASFAQRARTIDQMRRFVSDASHELRTPLVSVRGYAELYRMGALPTEEEVAQAMDRIEREAIRMAGLVEDLLALARLDEARPLESSAVDMRLIAHDTALDAMARDHDRDVDLIEWTAPGEPGALGAASEAERPAAPGSAADAPAGQGQRANSGFRRRTRRNARETPPGRREEGVASPGDDAPRAASDGHDALVWGEENKLRQVLTNIVNNALRYTPDGSPLTIAVGVDPSDDAVIVEVRDHGPGIPEQLRGKIFERFFRADTSRTRDTGGSGLGLAIVAAIVAAHGGTVSAHETPGGGATFRIVLPQHTPTV